MAFSNMGQIFVKKREFPQIASLYIVLLPLCFGLFIDLFRVPNIIKYTIDVFWLILLILMVVKRTIIVKKNTLAVLTLVVAFFLYALIVYLFNYQSVFYFLWGLRNNFRFYILFFAIINFLTFEDSVFVFKVFDIIFWINAAVCLIQYFAYGYDQDNLGGIFGVERGVNAYTIIFFMVVLSRSILLYMSKQESTVSCFSKCGMALFISALAEIKAFFVLFFVVLVFSAILTSFSWRKLLILGSLAIAAVLAAMLLVNLFGFENFLSIEKIWETATQKHYSEAGTVNRLSAIPAIAKTLLNELPERIFGLGLGNCDTSTFDFCNSVFYQNYGHLRYTWFSCAILFLETGYIGILLFIAFFAICYILANKQLKAGTGNSVYCQMAMIMSVICVILTFYNSSLRTEVGYMVYFVLALPFLSVNTDSKEN